jgi:VanZ family protein
MTSGAEAAAPLHTREFFGRWLPVLLWGALIFAFSTGYFSGESTGSFILPVLTWLLPHASHERLELIHFFIRKCAHFSEYLVLGILLYRALGSSRVFGLPPALAAVLIAGLYAASDELHQAVVPGRTSSVIDCLIDLSGAATGQGLRAAARRLLRA